MIVLLVAATAALAAGVLAILIGIPVKEFSFGNTMILTGVMAVCTGLILFGLWVAVREMRALARQMALPAPERPHDVSLPEPDALPSYPVYPSFAPSTKVEDRAPLELPPQAQPQPQPPAQVQVQEPPQDDDEEDEPEPEVKPKTKRNLLFESSMRKDRERAAVMALQNAPAGFVVEAGQRVVFDDIAPPIRDRDRGERIPRTRSPSTYPDMQAAAGLDLDVSVLKSGVVDGMAYSLYSDGSIEAQMPEGMMRFSSIDELREHLEQRSI